MKKSLLYKHAVDKQDITPQQLEQIQVYTRRDMDPSQLFIFSLILCDNRIDRDFERFTKASLEKLATLYLGKTGIFDHEARAKHQSARIFNTQVVATDDSGYALKAYAYMVRCEKNKDLILEIDAGIKKEVSVGCAVEKTICSICNKSQKATPCSHQKGQLYEGDLCHHLLVNPTDAYEWSFVAVPAQKGAGVVKNYKQGDNLPTLLKKINAAPTHLALSPLEVTRLSEHLVTLEKDAEAGQVYTQSLQKDIVRKASFLQPHLDSHMLENLCRRMTLPELEAFSTCYKIMSQNSLSPFVQLQKSEGLDTETETSFQI